jgi:hypothetical protein
MIYIYIYIQIYNIYSTIKKKESMWFAWKMNGTGDLNEINKHTVCFILNVEPKTKV